MNENGERRNSISIPVPWGSKHIEIRGLTAIMVMLIALIAAMGTLLWDHAQYAKEFGNQYISAMKVVSQSIEDSAIAQREAACLIAKEGSARERAFSSGECRRLAEIGARRN